jgi:hypothetical protein
VRRADGFGYEYFEFFCILTKICGFWNEILEGEDIVVLFVEIIEKEVLRLHALKYKKVRYTEVSFKHHSYECWKALNEKHCMVCSCSFPQDCVPGYTKRTWIILM